MTIAKRHQNNFAETPGRHAEELGGNYIESKNKRDVTSLAQYFTPQAIAGLIARRFSLRKAAKSVQLNCEICRCRLLKRLRKEADKEPDEIVRQHVWKNSRRKKNQGSAGNFKRSWVATGPAK